MATTVLGLKTFAASDPVDYNEVNDNYVKIDNGVKTALQGRAAHNLLDNSNFTNPVNQRGQTSYISTQHSYTIDRWYMGFWTTGEGTGTTNIEVKANGIRLYGGTDSTSIPNSCNLSQKLDASKMLGKTYTLAVNVLSISGSSTSIWLYASDNSGFIKGIYLKEGINVLTFAMPSSSTTFVAQFGNFASKGGNGSVDVLVAWAALYEGSYDASTLPAYVPKGYAAELAECQRYYLPLNHQLLGSGYTFPDGATFIVPRRMRIDEPSFVSDGTILARVNGADYPLTLSYVTTYESMIKVNFTSDNIPVNYPCAFYAEGSIVSLNADL